MSDILEKLLSRLTYYRLINQWLPGFILEILFLLLFYESWNLDGIALNFFGVDPTIIFSILFLCGGGIFGFILVGIGGPITYGINAILFGRSEKISLDESDKIDEMLLKEKRMETYHAVEDYNIIQVFLAELSITSLFLAIMLIFTQPTLIVHTLILIASTLFLFLLDTIVGLIMVRKYESLAFLLKKK